jgi:glutamate-ammonia-ligase adenylyltransferase
VGTALRRERSGLAVALGIGDLAGLLTLEEVTRSLSDFADRALQRAVSAALAERTPDTEPRGFAVIALGSMAAASSIIRRTWI